MADSEYHRQQLSVEATATAVATTTTAVRASFASSAESDLALSTELLLAHNLQSLSVLVSRLGRRSTRRSLGGTLAGQRGPSWDLRVTVRRATGMWQRVSTTAVGIGGVLLRLPETLHELLTIGGIALGIEAVAVRTVDSAALIGEIGLLRDNDIVVLTTNDEEQALFARSGDV